MANQKLSSFMLLLILMVYMPNINGQTRNDENELVKYLFNGTYNKYTRPTPTGLRTQKTEIYIEFKLLSIVDIDSVKEQLTTTGYLLVAWNDFDLKWDPAKFSNIQTAYILESLPWKPSITLKNDVSQFQGSSSGFSTSALYVIVNSNGYVQWFPYGIFRSSCNMDITYFPFDIHTCAMKFWDWDYWDADLNLTYPKSIPLAEYEENSEWSVLSTSVSTEDITEITVVFNIKLRRKPLFVVLNVVVPVMMFSIMSVFVFVLPVDSGEKASFAVTVLLAQAIYFTVVMTILPQSSDQVSYFNVYLVIVSGLSSLVVISTLFELRLLSRNVDVDPIPSCLFKLQMCVEAVRCKRRRKVRPVTGSQDDVSNIHFGSKEVTKVTWKSICGALDFVFFWSFLAANIISSVTVFFICATH